MNAENNNIVENVIPNTEPKIENQESLPNLSTIYETVTTSKKQDLVVKEEDNKEVLLLKEKLDYLEKAIKKVEEKEFDSKREEIFSKWKKYTNKTDYSELIEDIKNSFGDKSENILNDLKMLDGFVTNKIKTLAENSYNQSNSYIKTPLIKTSSGSEIKGKTVEEKKAFILEEYEKHMDYLQNLKLS